MGCLPQPLRWHKPSGQFFLNLHFFSPGTFLSWRTWRRPGKANLREKQFAKPKFSHSRSRWAGCGNNWKHIAMLVAFSGIRRSLELIALNFNDSIHPVGSSPAKKLKVAAIRCRFASFFCHLLFSFSWLASHGLPFQSGKHWALTSLLCRLCCGEKSRTSAGALFTSQFIFCELVLE